MELENIWKVIIKCMVDFDLYIILMINYILLNVVYDI